MKDKIEERCLICRKFLFRNNKTKLCSNCQNMNVGEALRKGIVILKDETQRGESKYREVFRKG